MGRISARSLTAKQVEHESQEGYHADGPHTGLYLQVKQGKSGLVRSWIYRYTSPTTCTRREIGLGSVRVRKLADARAIALEYRLQVLDGVDPKDKRDKTQTENATARANQITFDEACALCIKAKEPGWKNAKHTQQWRNTLAAFASPLLGKLSVDSITTELVFKVLEPIWLEKTETATRVRQRIEAVLDWCAARGYRNGENPARLKGALGELLPKSNKISKVVHHPSIPYQQIYQFVQALRRKGGTGAFALEFILLTATRTSETIAANWDEFDLDTNVWSIPADRMKTGREHRVPICDRAIEILEIMRRVKRNSWVFPAPSTKSVNHISLGTCLVLMKRMPDYAAYTPHGLRASFRDWGAETTNFSNETLEMALAHTIKNKAEAAYRRGDQLLKRAKLMQQWEMYIEQDGSSDSIRQIKKVAGNN